MDDGSLRSAIDGIALEIAERGGDAEELRALIADKVLEYMAANREGQGISMTMKSTGQFRQLFAACSTV